MTNSEIDRIRRNIAEATHRAVCEFSASDGCGRCFDYALAGWYLATERFRREYVLQAGSLYIRADPPDGVVAMEPGEHGFERGEFHCWFGVPGIDGKGAEFIDLSSRHYRQLVERGRQCSEVVESGDCSICVFSGEVIKWTREEEPPQFIWNEGDFPNVMWAVATREATNFFVQAVRDRKRQYAPLIRLARMHYRRLSGEGGQSARVMPLQRAPRVGRNASCPCGSGRKFKRCCLRKQTIDNGALSLGLRP